MPSRIVETLREGDGATFPKTGDKVLVHYTGCIASTGSAFDSSRARGHAFTFILGVGKVIPGWDELVPQLSKGSRVRVHIPSEDGYGAKGNPPAVPPSTDLLFDIEVLDINETLVQARPPLPSSADDKTTLSSGDGRNLVCDLMPHCHHHVIS